MYSYKERMTAVMFYIKHGYRVSYTLRVLGYPSSRKSLYKWYDEYKTTNTIHKTSKACDHSRGYTKEQIKKVINHYFQNGRNKLYTIKSLGYPCRYTLHKWLMQYAAKEYSYNTVNIKKQVDGNLKEEIAKAVVCRTKSVTHIAKDNNLSRVSVYKYAKTIAGDIKLHKHRKQDDNINYEHQELLEQIKQLKEEIDYLKMKNDVLEQTNILLKKDKSINQKITNKDKVSVIDALKNKYSISKLLKVLKLSKSSYYYQKKVQKSKDKYEQVKQLMVTIFNDNYQCFGYRRIQGALNYLGVKLSDKLIRKLMKKALIFVTYKKKKKYSSYMGEISPAASNIIKRDFHCRTPNHKLLTDLTEFSIPSGKIYLSPLIDCFDGYVLSWTIGTNPSANLVNSMLDNAISNNNLKKGTIIHSDRGAHYRWAG